MGLQPLPVCVLGVCVRERVQRGYAGACVHARVKDFSNLTRGAEPVYHTHTADAFVHLSLL